MLQTSAVTFELDWPEYNPDRGDCKPPIYLKQKPAKYQCLGCSHTWQGLAGYAECKMCSSRYIKWLDYKE